MNGSSHTTRVTPGPRVRLSGRLDQLTTRKDSAGFTLFGSLRLDSPYRGLSRMTFRLPIGSALLAGDSAELEGVLLPVDSGWMLDCSDA